MLDLITDKWQALKDTAESALAFAADVALTLYAAAGALPLPMAALTIAASAAAAAAILQRPDH